MGLPIAGFISSSVLGWPGIFRFYGILSGIIGAVLWFMLADTPAKHPKISEAERRYIEEGMGHKAGYEQVSFDENHHNIHICTNYEFRI